MKKYLVLAFIIFAFREPAFTQAKNSTQTYPQIIGLVSIIHPIIGFDKNGSTFNFNKSYTVIFPIGINILKSDKIGFSFEVAPTIRVANDTDKVTNFVFDPGIIFRCKHNFSFITRVAFETNGRYGFTPVISKVVIKKSTMNYFVAASAPVRFGNEKPASVGLSFQVGIVF